MRLRILTALLLGGCAAIALTGQAPAKPKKQESARVSTVTASTFVAPFQGLISELKATCPKHTHAISGGFRVTPDSGAVEPPTFTVFQSLPFGARGWSVAGIQPTATPAPVKFVAYAYCRSSGPRPFGAMGSRTLDPGEKGTVTATCPKGTRVVGGGFRDQTDPGTDAIAIPYESRRTGKRTWRSGGISQGSAPVQLQAVGFCLPASEKLKKLKTKKKTVAGPVNNGQLVTATAKGCPRKKRGGALAGGFLVSFGAGGDQLAIQESRRLGRRWQTNVRSILLPADTRTTGYAYCP